MNNLGFNLVTAVSIVVTAVAAFATFRAAQLASKQEHTETTVVRRPRPAESQTPDRDDAHVSAPRVPWIVVSVAILTFWLIMVILRPIRFLPVHNPTASNYLGTTEAQLEVDLNGRRLEEGDAFVVRLILVGRRSSTAVCTLAEGNVSASLAVAAADLVEARSMTLRRPTCVADAEWIVVPKHAGRQIIAARIVQRIRSTSSLATLEATVDIDHVFGGEAVLNGLIPVLVALVGILTANRKGSGDGVR